MSSPIRWRRIFALGLAALVLVAASAAVSAHYCLTRLFPEYLARELATPTDKPFFHIWDIPAPGGRGGGCDVMPSRGSTDRAFLEQELRDRWPGSPGKHCLIRVIGDLGNPESVGELLAYATRLEFTDVPAKCSTIAAALLDIGGPLVHKTALALMTSDDFRLMLIGALVLPSIVNARERAWLHELPSDPSFRARDKYWMVEEQIYISLRPYHFGSDKCGRYGCVPGGDRTGKLIPLTADD